MIICLIIGSIHLGIVVFHALVLIRYKTIDRPHSSPLLSIIVAAKNEEKNLKKLIPRLLEQKYHAFEIIIGLDQCTDESLNYLRSIKSEKIQIIDIDEVPSDWNSKKYALNESIRNSTGEWLVFIDADCVPHSNQWLSSFSSQIHMKTNFIIGVSPYTANTSLLSQHIAFEAFQTAFLYVSRALLGKPYMAVGRNMAIRKSYFEKISGYEKIRSITGGDDDLMIQNYASKENTRILLEKQSIVYTFPDKHWKNYWNQKIRHYSVGKKYKPKDLSFLSLFHFSHLFFLIFLFFNLSHTYFLPTLLFYLFIKLVSYRFVAGKMGMNINYMLFPIVDMLYALLTPVIALQSKLKKDIKWKN
ncbi:glycosyltransferase [Ekhidna sp.]